MAGKQLRSQTGKGQKPRGAGGKTQEKIPVRRSGRMARRIEVSFPSPAESDSSVARLTLLYIWEAGAEHKCHSERSEESRSDSFFPGSRARTRARFLSRDYGIGMTQTLRFGGFLMPGDVKSDTRVAPLGSLARRRLPPCEFGFDSTQKAVLWPRFGVRFEFVCIKNQFVFGPEKR